MGLVKRRLPKNSPFKVGVTGGIGAGKSTVSEIFKVLGVPVFNSDIVGKKILSSDQDAIAEVKNHFGEESYAQGSLNRAYLAEAVFENPEKRKQLNQIVHPRVRAAFDSFSESHSDGYVINEAAILIESGGHKAMDVIILVHAPMEERIKRTVQRDKVNRQQVESRINAQMTDAEKLPLATFTINNDGLEAILPQVLQIHNTIIRSL